MKHWTDIEKGMIKAAFDSAKEQNPEATFKDLIERAQQVLPEDRRRKNLFPSTVRFIGVCGAPRSPRGVKPRIKIFVDPAKAQLVTSSPEKRGSDRMIEAVRGLVADVVERVFEEAAIQMEEARAKVHVLRQDYLKAKFEGDEVGAARVMRQMSEIRNEK